jgi:hypothetical protein
LLGQVSSLHRRLNAPYRDQLVYDSHILQFQQIVQLADTVAEIDQAPASSIISGQCFILNIRIVQTV